MLRELPAPRPRREAVSALWLVVLGEAASGSSGVLLGLARTWAINSVPRVWTAERGAGTQVPVDPQRAGIPELVGFVTLPALLPVLFSRQFLFGFTTILANAAILALTYVVVGFGLVFIVWWSSFGYSLCWALL